MFGTGTGKTVKIEIEVSLDNECTASPWWFIIDPKQNMGCGVHEAASQVTGPFFSREEGELVLKQKRHHFSHRAVVFCGSAYYTHQYDKAYREAERRPQPTTNDETRG